MHDDLPRETYTSRSLPRRVRVRPSGWIPGELFVTAEVDSSARDDLSDVVSELRQLVRQLLGDEAPVVDKPVSNGPILATPRIDGLRRQLLVPIELVSTESRVMRVAVGRLNRNIGQSLGSNAIFAGATPNWFGAAQDCCGGSPASQPVAAEPFGGEIRYVPRLSVLDHLEDAENDTAPRASIQVAILDTAPEQADIDRATAAYPHNRHLQDVIGSLQSPIGHLAVPALDAELDLALKRLERNGGFVPIEPAEAFDIRDHGLFVASVVHATSPWVRMRLVRVLNNFGVGSLHSLVTGLLGVLDPRSRTERMVINLSLGMLPALEQLAFIWFGFAIDGLPGCPEDPTLQFLEDSNASPSQLRDMVTENDPAIQKVVEQLHAPVARLMEILQAHNCVVVAAAGNDSVFRGVERIPRWGPRIPALYDSVLGVAADTVRPSVSARYSNRGEVATAIVRDAVATLGGDLAGDGLSPSSGVIGVYTAPQFPPLFPPSPPAVNTTGWAEWSGTSFATPIMAGAAANLWATDPAETPKGLLEDINEAARSRPDVADLGVPGVPVRLIWLP